MSGHPLPASGSILFITLDSCRYDTFVAADTPHLKAVGELHRAMAPSHFTYGSHAAMFVGFTPGIAERREPFVNPKFGKLFKLVGGGFPGKGTEWIALQGRSIIDGLKQRGYRAIGSGAAGWFDPSTATGQLLSGEFDAFYFPGNTWSLPEQLVWMRNEMAQTQQPVFAFLNIGETHVPYYHRGAAWSPEHNPCVPFGEHNDANECRRRQRACLEFVDRELAELLTAFAGEMTLVCADHGDCWGEDGLWEHGISHPKTLEVPLLFRLPPTAA